jgi:alpha-tubulin suppressor-like RCC1 family protein
MVEELRKAEFTMKCIALVGTMRLLLVLCAVVVSIVLLTSCSSGGQTGSATTTTQQENPLAYKIAAWGANDKGQLGNGTTTDSNTTIMVSTLTSVTAIFSATDHSLALKNDGTVWAWGSNWMGTLGTGTSAASNNTPLQVTDPIDSTGYLSGVTAISGGVVRSLALKEDGTVWAWGFNEHGELGNGTNGPGTQSTTPVEVTDSTDSTGYLTDITAISAADTHSLALRKDSTVWAWGGNWVGQLGTETSPVPGKLRFSDTPVEVTDPADSTGYLSGVTAISAGGVHSLALKKDGTVWAWGVNDKGQLGDASTTNSTTPVEVSNLSDVTAISAGASHSLALCSTCLVTES